MLGTIADIIEIFTFCISLYLLLRGKHRRKHKYKHRISLHKKVTRQKYIFDDFTLGDCIYYGLCVVMLICTAVVVFTPEAPKLLVAVALCTTVTLILFSAINIMSDRL